MNDSQHLNVIFVINFMTAFCSFVFRVITITKHSEFTTPKFNIVLDTLMGYSTIQLTYIVWVIIYEMYTRGKCKVTKRRSSNQLSYPRWP